MEKKEINNKRLANAARMYSEYENSVNHPGNIQDAMAAAFEEGAMWSVMHPESSWIDVRDRMPQNQEVFRYVIFAKKDFGFDEITYRLFDLEEPEVIDMCGDPFQWEKKYLCELIAWKPLQPFQARVFKP